MCIHGEAGREHEEEHTQGGEYHRGKGKGSIFANAASVLSMAAEEISLDDHLEKELANEVELWRLDTSSTPVPKTTLGLAHEGKSGLNGVSTVAHGSQFAGPFADTVAVRERSSSPTLRTQVSLHNRLGGGVPSRPASGTVATSPVPERPGSSSSATDRATSAPLVKSRQGSGTPLRERTFLDHDDCKVPIASIPPGGGEGDGAGGPPPPSESAAAAAAETAAAAAPCSAPADDGAAAAAAAVAEAASGGDAAAGEGTAPLEDPPEVVAPPCPERDFIPREKRAGGLLHAKVSDGLAEGPPDPSADDREVDNFSSSEEESFMGFIEDPLEKERVCEERWVQTPVKRSLVLATCHDAGDPPDPSMEPREARMWTVDQVNGPPRSSSADIEEVRPDRSIYF